MEIDAAQYANMSREMLQSHNYLQVYDQGQDYLDKPPMLFWLSSFSMWLLGVNSVAYRLPSFLFSLVAIWSCYRLTRLFYAREIAGLAAIVLASCQAMFLINHDVRTDTMLMGWVTLLLWQLAAWHQTGRWKNLLLAGLALAGGLMTKGPLTAMVAVFAFVPHFILRRHWKALFRWEYLVLVAVAILLMVPMMIGLYQQFDLHPEKVMWGRQGTSGLRFFFWTQSFGRITGENTWHEYDSFFFLFQNMLWSFLPWVIFFVCALVADIRSIFRKKFLLSPTEECISTGGFIVTYCALASSRAQLPHYIFVVFPLAAIITAKFLHKLLYEGGFPRLKTGLIRFHYGLFIVLWLALPILLMVPFSFVNKMAVLVCLAVMVGLYVVLNSRLKVLHPFLRNSLFTMMGINILLNLFFYPSLLQFQPGVKVSQVISEKNILARQVYLYNFTPSRSLDFEANHTFQTIHTPDSLPSGSYILTSKASWDSLPKNQYRKIFEGEQFHVTKLTLKFLNPATRHKETDRYFIAQRL